MQIASKCLQMRAVAEFLAAKGGPPSLLMGSSFSGARFRPSLNCWCNKGQTQTSATLQTTSKFPDSFKVMVFERLRLDNPLETLGLQSAKFKDLQAERFEQRRKAGIG